MSMRTQLTSLSAAALLCVGVATAQNARPIAFTNARIHTVSGDVVENGTVVVRNGKIEAVGADVTIPAGAKRVDATGKTIMPGLVSAWSRAGMSRPTPRSNTPTRRGRRSRGPRMPTSRGGRASNQAATRVVDGLYTRQNIFQDLLEVVVTSLALNPSGGGFPGLGAVLNPAGKTRGELTQDDEAFVQIGMQRNGATKKLLKDTFAKAKNVLSRPTKLIRGKKDFTPSGKIDESLLVEDAEIEFFNAYKKTCEKIAANQSIASLIEALAEMEEPSTRFFEDVFVNCEDLPTRQNRLDLIDSVASLPKDMVDFSVLPGF